MKALQSDARRATRPDGSEFTYHCTGRGLPVLLCNGLGGPREVWRPLIAQLSDRYRFLAWDYQGLGADDGDDAAAISVRGCAQDACAILDAESISRASIVGWSLGVAVALEVFRFAPSRVASLVLINGAARAAWAAGGDSFVGKVLATTLRAFHRAPALVEHAMGAGLRAPEAFTWARRLGIVGDQVSADTFTEVTRAYSRVPARALLSALASTADHDSGDVLHLVDVPTLVIAGDRDPFTRRAAMETLVHEIAGAEYLLLPGATHFVMLDQAERVNLRIEKFWNERGYRSESRVSMAPTPPA